MEIVRHPGAGYLELAVEGRLDGYWAQHLSAAVDEVIREGTHSVRLNLARASYISSAGIGVLVETYKRLAAVQGSLRIVEPSRHVRQLLEMVGLAGMLLDGAEVVLTAPAAATAVRREAGGVVLEIYDEAPGASMVCSVVGSPQRLTSCDFGAQDCHTIPLTQNRVALGLGAFGEGFDQCHDRFGEFLAVAGAGAFQPTDGSNFPDYMMASGSFVPQLAALYALSCEGGFSKLLRFESSVANDPVPLSAVVKNCLEAAGGGAVAIVMLAESAGLIGAWLKRAPVRNGELSRPFVYPEVRRWLSFSPERRHGRAVALVVGIASAEPVELIRPLVRPLARGGEIHGHFHAAAFAYRPLPRGRLEMKTAVRGLFEAGGLEGVLHLLADDRETSGGGETEFRRGACWIAPIREFTPGEPDS